MMIESTLEIAMPPTRPAKIPVPFQVFLEIMTKFDPRKVSPATIDFVSRYTHSKPCDLTTDYGRDCYQYFEGIPYNVAIAHVLVDVPVGNAAAMEVPTWQVRRILNGDFSREAVEIFPDVTRQLIARTVGSNDASIESTMENGARALQRLMDRNASVAFPDIGNPFDCLRYV